MQSIIIKNYIYKKKKKNPLQYFLGVSIKGIPILDRNEYIHTSSTLNLLV